MEQKKRYNTKQYEEILEYLSTCPGNHFTVNDLNIYFSQIGKPIGVTTIYRQLQRMLEEGLVTKYVVGPSDPACYEFHGDKSQAPISNEYHCKCESCGKLIHVKCEKIRDIEEHLEEHHGFKVDTHRTVFYGICEECQKKEGNR